MARVKCRAQAWSDVYISIQYIHFYKLSAWMIMLSLGLWADVHHVYEVFQFDR